MITPAAAALFFSLLTVAALLGVATVLVLAGLRALGVESAAGLFDRVRDAVAPSALLLAFAVAAVATLGSLYFSEVANYVPCKLCWYQRIAAYPLAVILGVAAWRRSPDVRAYAIPVAAIGLAISSYHYLIERFPDLDSGACDVAVPCTLVWFERFGFVTLPFMAGVTFASIITLLVLTPGRSPHRHTTPSLEVTA